MPRCTSTSSWCVVVSKREQRQKYVGRSGWSWTRAGARVGTQRRHSRHGAVCRCRLRVLRAWGWRPLSVGECSEAFLGEFPCACVLERGHLWEKWKLSSWLLSCLILRGRETQSFSRGQSRHPALPAIVQGFGSGRSPRVLAPQPGLLQAEY